MAPVRDVAFELEAFEWSEDRLDVVGRWKGLAGRRLARPVLTVQLDSGRRKRVVAMPGGQLSAPGESWQASFNWPGDPAEIIGVELELGRNVVVELPLPDRRRRRRRSRHQSADQSVTEELRLEAGALRAQVDRLRAELAGRERELMAAREQLSELPVQDQPTMALRSIEPADDAEPAPAAADEGELARLRAEHEAERAHWQEEMDALRESFAAAAEEAEQTRKRHQAELATVRAEAAVHERARRHLRRGPAAPPAEPDLAAEEYPADETEPAFADDPMVEAADEPSPAAATDADDASPVAATEREFEPEADTSTAGAAEDHPPDAASDPERPRPPTRPWRRTPTPPSRTTSTTWTPSRPRAPRRSRPPPQPRRQHPPPRPPSTRAATAPRTTTRPRTPSPAGRRRSISCATGSPTSSPACARAIIRRCATTRTRSRPSCARRAPRRPRASARARRSPRAGAPPSCG